MAVTHLMETVDRADTLVEKDPAQAAAAYLEVLQSSGTYGNARKRSLQEREAAILKLGQLYRTQRAAKELAALLNQCRTFLVSLPKAKTSKIANLDIIASFLHCSRTSRTRIAICFDMFVFLVMQVQGRKEAIAGPGEENTVIGRLFLEPCLQAMFGGDKMYTEAQALIAHMVKDGERLGVKVEMQDQQLLESRVFHALRNLHKARASLTSARRSGNSIERPAVGQGGKDMQSGILHGADKELAALLNQCRTFLVSLPKAKTAKIVRTLIDYFSDIPDSLALQVQVCKEAIDWAAEEKRIFLRQSLETRLAAMYLDHKMYTEALALIAQLLKELKRLDDKLVLVDVQLLESRVFHALRNLAKARASLTSARTAANSIYCPPVLQAGLDMQSGILHAEDKDFKTGYSYFYETLEGYASQDDARAVTALKYLLMSKIMLNAPEDVHSLAQQKVAVRFANTPEVAAMKAVAVALQHRSLLEFEQALSNFRAQLTEDPVVRLHLSALYDTLLEQNLLRIIEPYSRVEITHVAQLVKLPLQQVEQKLSQLILDGKLKGVLDQGACVLIVYEETQTDQTYHDALETVKKLGTVVDSLYQKAATLS
ncbi:hypothetical protein AMAG_09039 [Allomyces macrogynus ATCC 38327]|uniref:PCI domain-containing protein n=1 Tax=Allomyces macrogynus (strain ATCC 38327) TaxID=578462 RepID=A0A0L0SNB1_ALLM3|nr:hypothetical protein AMAG_09039 [Allomyces macrogynus ATCC 38327]|eukprot:KNE63977.1 hypothetical protein AMAG_09039 [Allomyces macrogynus ATCC 38327]